VYGGVRTHNGRRITGSADYELTLERYCNIALTPWLRLTPDLQRILDPGDVGAGRDAFVTASAYR
jgi:carbohydrate-selective porin OprB